MSRNGGATIGGLAGWLAAKFRSSEHREPRLALLERIALAPRQSLALVEAEGRRILVATSAEGGPAFYPLDERIGWSGGGQGTVSGSKRGATKRQSRVTFSEQTQLIVLRGRVRPEDVSNQNQVLSTAMTDLELEVTGKGIVNDSTYRQNPLVRLLEKLLVF